MDNNELNLSYEERKVQIAKQDEADFKKIGIPTVIYTVVFVILMYENLMGVSSIGCAVATLGYIFYVKKQFEHANFGRFNIFLSVITALLIGINFLTGNVGFVLFNYFGVLLLTIVNGIYMFNDMSGVSVMEHVRVFLHASFGSIAHMGKPMPQLANVMIKAGGKNNKNRIYVFVGLIVAIPVIFVVMALLASADRVFAGIFMNISEFIKLDFIIADIFKVVLLFIVVFVGVYAFVINVKGKVQYIKKGKFSEYDPIIPIIVTASVSVLYVLFSGIQIIYLFMGNGSLPDGYTYAEYAREGFFQLLAVCMFNVMVVLGCLEFFKDCKTLKIINTVISICTYIMIASSGYRMSMYIREYGLTVTRVLVLWALVVIALLMAGLTIHIYSNKLEIFKYSVAVVSVCYVALSLSRVDYYIAEYNFNEYGDKMSTAVDSDMYEFVDYSYINCLSTDAAPVIAKHKDEMFKYLEKIGCELYNVEWSYQEHPDFEGTANVITIRNFNVSHYMAQKLYKDDKVNVVYNTNENADYIKKVLDRQVDELGTPSFGNGDWTMIAMERDGTGYYEFADKYLESLDAKLEETNGVISTNSYTDYARATLVLTALGKDASNYKGYDLVEPLKDVDKLKVQGINAVAYAVIAADSGEYFDVTEHIEYLVDSQLEDGGWAFAGNESDVDISLIVLQALSKHGDVVEASPVMDRGIRYIRDIQNDNGTFGLDGGSCETTAQALITLCEFQIQINDERFVKNGKSVADGLMLFYNDGCFSHTYDGDYNFMATDQALCALVDYKFNLIGERATLYKMK